MKSLFDSRLLAALLVIAPLSCSAALVATYDFSDGDLLNDSSGNSSSPGVLIQRGTTGNVTLNTAGGYASFPGGAENGTGASLQADFTGTIGGATYHSVSLWFRTSNVNQSQFVSIVSASSGDFSWQVGFDGSGSLETRFNGGSTQGGGVSNLYSNLQPDTWYHLAVVTGNQWDSSFGFVAGNNLNVFTMFVTPYGESSIEAAAGTTGQITGISGYNISGASERFRIGWNRSEGVPMFEGDIANVNVESDRIFKGAIDDYYANPNFAAVPEPSSSIVLLSSLTLLLRRKRA